MNREDNMLRKVEHNKKEWDKYYKDMGIFGTGAYKDNGDGTITHIPFDDMIKKLEELTEIVNE